MARASGSGQRPLGWPVIATLTVVGLVGLALVVVGLAGVGPVTSRPSVSTLPSHAGGSPTGPVATGPAPTGPATTASTSAGPASPSPARDPLVDGLLAEADLPGMASPLGPQEGTTYDIDDAAFEASGGIRVVSRTWQSLADTGLAAVFDFRMQFPTDAAAAAYLEAAEPVLSEATATGQSPVPSPPVIGSDTRVYGLEAPGATGTVLLRTYLFRVGSVAAKLVVGGPGLGAMTADGLARTAVARMLAAGSPGTGSPRPTVSPTAEPTVTAPLPTGQALAALLLDHVPPAIGPTCVPDTQRLWPGELATLACTDQASGVTVTYSGFDGSAAAEAAFDASLEAIDLGPEAGSCDQGAYVGTYDVEDEGVGRVACWAEQGGQAIMWSDDRLAILAVAVSPTLDAAGLYLWWLDAGPVP